VVVVGDGLTLAARARRSAWAAASPGLAREVAEWEREMAPARAALDVRAARLARPGLVPPLRAARHLAALRVAQLRWAVSRVPSDLAAGAPLRAPGDWLKRSVAHVVRDQLALLGPPAVEVARIIDESEGLAPGVIVEELRRRPLRTRPMPAAVVAGIARRALGVELADVADEPVGATPVGQVHHAVSDGRPLLVRVRRPGIDRMMRADARITAMLVAPFELAVPALAEAHPLGFVELAARQLLEESDLRNEALNAVALGLAVEDLGVDTVAVARPVPGLVHRRAAAFEALDGARPLTDGAAGLDADAALTDGAAGLDADAAVRALVALTVEAALTHGVFHADLRPEHLVVTGDGRLGVVGFGAAGRFDQATRRSALDYLAAVLGGDVAGQVAAMQAAGAVPDGVDLDALVADLEAAEALQPAAIFGGGEAALLTALREAVGLLLRHRLRPPLEVVLFVRTLFALRALLQLVAPDRPLLHALLPVVQRLPDLRAELV